MLDFTVKHIFWEECKAHVSYPRCCTLQKYLGQLCGISIW